MPRARRSRHDPCLLARAASSRTECFRERTARKTRILQALYAEARIRNDPGLFVFVFNLDVDPPDRATAGGGTALSQLAAGRCTVLAVAPARRRFTSGVSSPSDVARSGCARRGMCAARGPATCSESPRPTGRSRLGTAEVDSSCRVRPAVQDSGFSFRQRGFDSRTRLHKQQTRRRRRAHASTLETGRNDWAAPEPVTGKHSLR